ncbi:MAG: hypothetical protein ACYCPN_05355 [Thermoplasmata archaeon]
MEGQLEIDPSRAAGRWSPAEFLARGGRFLRQLAVAPEHRRLRWILVAGLVVRLLLAVTTAWPNDTASAIRAAQSVLEFGNPYTLGWGEPPLVPFLAAPTVALAEALFGAGSLLPVVPQLAPLATVTGFSFLVSPSPAALLAWKAPLILSDFLVGLLLYHLAGQMAPSVLDRRPLVVALWILNPLVIWSSVVDGEVDSFVALFLLLLLLSLLYRWWAIAGVAIALGTFTKGYPFIFLPVALVVAVGPALAGLEPWAAARRALLRLGAGIVPVLLVFLFLASEVVTILSSDFFSTAYGGASLTVIFNPSSPTGGWYGQVVGSPWAPVVLMSVLRGLAAIGVVAGALLLAGTYARSPSISRRRLPGIWWALLLTAASVLLADPTPQPERLLGVLSLLPLGVVLVDRRRWVALTAALTASGFTIYAAFVTPLGVFFPTITRLGPSATHQMVNWVLAYAAVPLLRGSLWYVAGLLGGATLLAIWFFTLRELYRDFREHRAGAAPPLEPSRCEPSRGERLETEEGESRRRLAELQALKASGVKAEELYRQAEVFCARLREGLDHLTFEERVKVVRWLIERVVVKDGEVTVEHVIPLEGRFRRDSVGSGGRGDVPISGPAKLQEVAAPSSPPSGAPVAGDFGGMWLQRLGPLSGPELVDEVVDDPTILGEEGSQDLPLGPGHVGQRASRGADDRHAFACVPGRLRNW